MFCVFVHASVCLHVRMCACAFIYNCMHSGSVSVFSVFVFVPVCLYIYAVVFCV